LASDDKVETIRGMFRDLTARSREIGADLLRENERLRQRVQRLETDIETAEKALTNDLESTRSEHERLSRQALELAEENLDFAKRYVELEEHAAGLANLYAATFQLHAALDPARVVQTISEIAINLIGAADFVLYLVDDARGDLVVTAREGEMSPNVTRIAAPAFPLEREAIESRKTCFAEMEAVAGRARTEPICCTPLFFHDRLVGILTIFALLSHKRTFSALDRELFDLLGGQAALAIVSSQCYVSVDRKLKTVQRFIDLLKT